MFEQRAITNERRGGQITERTSPHAGRRNISVEASQIKDLRERGMNSNSRIRGGGMSKYQGEIES